MLSAITFWMGMTGHVPKKALFAKVSNLSKMMFPITSTGEDQKQ